MPSETISPAAIEAMGQPHAGEPQAAQAANRAWQAAMAMADGGWRLTAEIYRRRPLVTLAIEPPADPPEGWQIREVEEAYASFVRTVTPTAEAHATVAKLRSIRGRITAAEVRMKAAEAKLAESARAKAGILASEVEPDVEMIHAVAALDIAAARAERERRASERERNEAAALLTDAFQDAAFAVQHYIATPAIAAEFRALTALREHLLTSIIERIDATLFDRFLAAQARAIGATSWTPDRVVRSLETILGPAPDSYVPLPSIAQDPSDVVDARREAELAAREVMEATNRGTAPVTAQPDAVRYVLVPDDHIDEHGHRHVRRTSVPVIEHVEPAVESLLCDPFAESRERLPRDEVISRQMFAAAIL